VTFYLADTPLLPKKLGWYIQKGGLYYETVQRLTARITETGTKWTIRGRMQRLTVKLIETSILYNYKYETVQRLTAGSLTNSTKETDTSRTMRKYWDTRLAKQRQIQCIYNNETVHRNTARILHAQVAETVQRSWDTVTNSNHEIVW
jgi:hypothetical protein